MAASHSESHDGRNVCDCSISIWIRYRPFIGLDQSYTISLLCPFSYCIALKHDDRFFYEAFPEELTFRGTVYNALNRRFNCFIALLLQPILFVLAPLTVSGLQYIAGIESPAITLDYIVLLLSFGFILQLLRIATGSLWTSIGFHLAFLENSRFFVLQGDKRFITYEEIVPGTGALFVIFFMLIIVGTLLLIPAVIARWRRRNKDCQDD